MRRLATYQAKRDFDITPAPGVRAERRSAGKNQALRYVVQLHHASHRHFDFRLEWQGSLRGWAIPKGSSRDPKQKRFAVQVEDHPISYGDFEGDILAGQAQAARKAARKAALQRLLSSAPEPLQLSDTIVGDGRDAAAAACRLGLEGIVSQSRSAPYQRGRSGAWLKVKCVQSDEFVIVGYTRGKGTRAELGSLLLAQAPKTGSSWRYVGRVGRGLSDAVIADLRKRFAPSQTGVPLANPPTTGDLRGAHPVWIESRLVVEVNFRAWAGDGILRQASLKGVRPDKSPGDVAAPDRVPRVSAAQGKAPRKSAKAARAAPTTTAQRRSARPAGAYPLTHPDRLIFADPSISKAGIGALYTDIAAQILPKVAARPLALLCCPDGAGGDCFFQKHLTPGFRNAVHTAPAKSERDPYVYIDDLYGLLAVVQMNVVEIHPWGAKLADPDTPDRLVFDLDPAPDVCWRDVKATAAAARERLSALKLESFLRASGGKGSHVVVPLSGKDGWDAAKAFAHALAKTMAQDVPDRYRAVARKARRKGRIFIDYLRNSRGATSVASYSLRARPGAPIAVPLAWDELWRLRAASQFNAGNIRKRIAAHLDPGRGIDDVEQALPR